MLHRHSRFVSTAFALAAASLGARAAAQCSTSWLPGLSLPGVDGVVNAMTMWDPDGAGPATPVAVVAGRFSVAGSVVTQPGWVRAGIATYDPATGVWGALGATGFTPLLTDVHALVVMPNGDLVIGGRFDTVGGITVNNIARWNGSVWSALGTGIAGPVRALAVMPNGDLVAGGDFFAAFGGFDHVARWNGTTWSSIGSGLPTSWWQDGVRALAVLPNGDLVAGGRFWDRTGGCLARWNGTGWSPLGGMVDHYVHALVVAPNGDLFAGGEFTLAGGVLAERVARWNGVTWSGIGSGLVWGGRFGWGMFEPVRSLALLPNGDLIAGLGSETQLWSGGIARWDGAAWSSLGAGIFGSVKALTVLPNGDLLAGGQGGFAGTLGASGIGRWNGVTWSPLGTGFAGSVRASARMANGDLVVGGDFMSIGAVVAKCVARYDGVSWAPLGTGFDYGRVEVLAVLPNGDLLAGLDASFGGLSVNVARWNGTTWHPMPTPPGTAGRRIRALAMLPNGEIVAAGDIGVARWNGTYWSPMAGVGPVQALHVLPNGDLIAAEQNGYTYFVKRFHGATWMTLGGAFDGAVNALAVMPNGDLVAGGDFASVAGVPLNALARCDSVAWQPLGGLQYGSRVDALEVLPGGDLVVGGSFVTAPVADPYLGYYFGYQSGWPRSIGRWNGTGWEPMPELSGGPVAMLEMFGTELLVGGSFTSAGSSGVSGFVRLATSCPANAIALGSGCAGSGGPNVLSATSLPWIGTTFCGEASGIPAFGFALTVTGFGALSLPLSSILPQGGAGCFLLATPDVLVATPPVAGIVATALAIPASAGLVGQVFHQQVLLFDVSALGTLTAVTSTNGLTAVIGHF